ncbi:MAG: hypothetical protein WAV09_04255 [Minisyncoccia bacterium]
MATELETKIILSAEDKTKSAFASASNSIEKMQPAFKNMAKVGAASFIAIASAAAITIKAYADSQAQLQKVDTIIDTFSKNTLKGFSGSVTKAQTDIRKFGAEMQKLGGIADEEASEGVAKLTQITGNYTKAQNAARIAADLSIFKNIDYSSAVDIVGKVLSGNVSILSRYGVQLEKNATVEEAMAALAMRTAGQYEASGKTINGQMKILKESIGDVQEEIGKGLAPAILKVTETLLPLVQKFAEWAANNPELIANLILVGLAISGIGTAIGIVGVLIPKVWSALILMRTAFLAVSVATGIASLPLIAITVAIVALIAAIVLLYKNWDTIWKGIVNVFNKSVDWILEKIKPLIKAWEFMKSLGAGSMKLQGSLSTGKIDTSGPAGIEDTIGSIKSVFSNGLNTIGNVKPNTLQGILSNQEANKSSSTPVYNFNFAGDVYDKNNFEKMLKGSMSDMLSTKKALPF